MEYFQCSKDINIELGYWCGLCCYGVIRVDRISIEQNQEPVMCGEDKCPHLIEEIGCEFGDDKPFLCKLFPFILFKGVNGERFLSLDFDCSLSLMILGKLLQGEKEAIATIEQTLRVIKGLPEEDIEKLTGGRELGITPTIAFDIDERGALFARFYDFSPR